jgi:hypothetical protein
MRRSLSRPKNETVAAQKGARQIRPDMPKSCAPPRLAHAPPDDRSSFLSLTQVRSCNGLPTQIQSLHLLFLYVLSGIPEPNAGIH